MPVTLVVIPERRMPVDLAAVIARVDEVRERLPLVGKWEALAQILDCTEAESPKPSTDTTPSMHDAPGVI